MVALINAFVVGEVPEAGMAAFLEAAADRGFTPDETRALTLAVRNSGTVLCYPADARPRVDRHATGAVGDKISLALAPLLACLGFRVPMICGHGLGLTGGILDKLACVPGIRVDLKADQIVQQVQTVGCAISGPTPRMIPAEPKLRATREQSGTLDFIPFIAASILSRKLAENLDALVLDLPFGRGASLPTLEQARELAASLVPLGQECGVHTRALLTERAVPIGRCVGNWLEVKEAVACLEGYGPEDLRRAVVEHAAHLFVQTERVSTVDRARALAEKCLQSGAPRRRWDEMLSAQGADLEACARKLRLDHSAPVVVELTAPHAGFVANCDARAISEAVRSLGGGRLNSGELLAADVGLDHLAKPGDALEAGNVLARVHALDQPTADAALGRLENAFALSDAPLEVPPFVAEVI